jgi:translocation and assembly module TamA
VARIRLGLAATAASITAFEAPAGPALADEPRVVVEGVQDKALRQAIETYVGTTKRPPRSRFEARSRAAEAAEDAAVVLRSEGFYEYAVAPDVTASGDKLRPVLRIDPGQRFAIADPRLEFTGPEPDAKAQADALKAMSLKPGAPGRAAEVVAAEGRILAALQKDGYADAVAGPREVVADHADHSLRPTFHIEAKALVRLDGVQVKTSGRTNPRWAAGLAPWRTRDVYAPDRVAELERRLLDTGVYDQVTVSLAPQPDAQGLRPVIVNLADRPKANVSLGGSYSTREGPGVNGRLQIYNRLGRADTITLAAQYASILRRIDLDLSLPHWRAPQHTLDLGATAYQDDTTAFRERDYGVHADVNYRFAKTSFFTYGIAADYSDSDEKTVVNGQIVGLRRRLAILTGLLRLSLDRSDDPLNPTHGWRFDGRVDPTYGTGDSELAYAKAVWQVTGYLPFGSAASTVVAGRLKFGTIVSLASDLDIPASRRFYAGGGGSIRGYTYQAVGPRFPDNTPIGGQSLIEGSMELRQKVTRSLGLVGFVDAGTVSLKKFPDFRTSSVGVGAGVRYDLGFGPLRADIGVPLNRQKGDAPFAIYISIGQAF